MAAAALLDDAMAKFGGKPGCLLSLESPVCHSKNEDDIENPITIQAFVGAVGRGREEFGSMSIALCRSFLCANFLTP